MKLSACSVKPLLSKFLIGFASLRIIWIAHLSGILVGCLLMLAWVVMLTFATDTALSLLAQVGT
jgi:hypothetical protein